MARIRTVKPEFWTSEQVAECSTTTRLLFIGMWNFCDDGGNHPASLKQLKMQIFPSDDISVADIGVMVNELITNELIDKYEANGKQYWHVLGWHHQKIDKPNYKHPKYSTTTSQPFDDHSTTTSQPFPPVRESKGMEGNGMDLNKKENAGEEKAESNLYVIPSRKTFKMFVGWKPDPETWANKLSAAQHRVKPEQFTDYILAEFIRKNINSDGKTENQWQGYLIEAVIRGIIQPTPDKPKSHKQPEPEIDYSKPQNLIVPVVYPYDPEERARQSAEMKRIRKEQGR